VSCDHLGATRSGTLRRGQDVPWTRAEWAANSRGAAAAESAHLGGRRGQGVLDQLGVCFTQGQADDEWHCPRGPLSSGRSSHVMPLGSGRVFLGDRRFTTLCCHVYEDHRSEPRQESHIRGIFNCQISAQARQDSAPSTLAATSRSRWSGVVTQRLPSRRLPVVARGARSGCGT